MSFNFADPCLHPRVKSSAVSVDGYEIFNLVSPQATDRNRGYLVESFIKPPVSVTVQFPINIELESIVLGTGIRSHRSCAVEVYTHSQKKIDTWLFDEPEEKSYIESQEEVDAKKHVYSCVGRAQDPEAKHFRFINYGFRKHDIYGTLPKMPKRQLMGCVRDVELRSKFRNNLANVSHIMVRLTRAIHGTTCALNWIEIWGQPAWSTPRPWISHMLYIIKHQHGPQTTNIAIHPPTSHTAMIDKTSILAKESEKVPQELPEEFVDPITVDLLTMPVLLPCGKTINRSTLDRHVQEQAKWGQQASDPFTGIVFTDREKPVPNSSLKARIDQYLFQNPDIAKIHDIRVGRSSAMPESVTQSHLTWGSHPRKKADIHCSFPRKTSLLKRQLETPVDDIHGYFVPNKLRKTSPPLYRKDNQLENAIGMMPKSFHDFQKSSCFHTSRTSTFTHCSSDLESTLKATLAGLPSFLHTKQAGPVMTNSVRLCMICQKTEDIHLQYRLLCDHLICKDCVLVETAKQNVVTCRICHTDTMRADICKAHV